MAVRDRVSKHRRRMRAQGFRPVQIWVPDVRTPSFAIEARHQAAMVAEAGRTTDEQSFIEAVSAPWDDA
ncbi:MAG: antitoxin MazE family protein [Propioniciclava sp.]